MPTYPPCRKVPNDPFGDDTKADFWEVGLPARIYQLPYGTEAEKVKRLQEKLKYYNVRHLAGLDTLKKLKDRRDRHNKVIEHTIKNVEATEIVYTRGIFVGDYRFSNWVFVPGILDEHNIPFKHAVKAQMLDDKLSFFVVNITRAGIKIGRLDIHPLIVDIVDIFFQSEFINPDGTIDILKIKQQLR